MARFRWEQASSALQRCTDEDSDFEEVRDEERDTINKLREAESNCHSTVKEILQTHAHSDAACSSISTSGGIGRVASVRTGA